jgi:hypothetical protein
MSTSIKNAKTDSENLKTASQNLADNLNNELITAVGNAKGAWEEYAGKLREVIQLANEAMQKSQDADKNVFKDDYAQDYINYILSGGDPNSAKAKRILKERQQKIDEEGLNG